MATNEQTPVTHADEVSIATRKSKPTSVIANIDGIMYVYFHEASQALNKLLRDVYTSKLSARLSELEKDQEKHAIKLIRAANATTKSPLNIPKSVSVYELKRVQETFAKYDALYKSKQTVTSYSKTQEERVKSPRRRDIQTRSRCTTYLGENQKATVGKIETIQGLIHRKKRR